MLSDNLRASTSKDEGETVVLFEEPQSHDCTDHLIVSSLASAVEFLRTDYEPAKPLAA